MIPFPWIALIAIPTITAFVVLRRRNRQEPSSRASWMIYVTQIVAVTASGWVLVTAFASIPAVFGQYSAAHTTANVAAFSPWTVASPPKIEETAPYVFFAEFTSADIAVARADSGTRMLQTLGILVAGLPPVMLGVTTAILCGRIIQQRMFIPSLVRLSWISAGVFLVAGFGGQLLSTLAGFRLAQTAFGILATTHTSSTFPTPIWPAALDLWPLWGALALGVLAVLLSNGNRLQRDTEGLV